MCQSIFSILLKKRLWHRCVPVNLVNFLRTPILKSTSGRLLLKFKLYLGGDSAVFWNFHNNCLCCGILMSNCSCIQYTAQESCIQYTAKESCIQYTAQKSCIQYTAQKSCIQYTAQFLADLVTLTEEILNGKLHFLCCGSPRKSAFNISFFSISF